MYAATPFFEHFSEEGHHSFLEDVSIKLIDKSDSSNPLQRENYWRSTLKTTLISDFNYINNETTFISDFNISLSNDHASDFIDELYESFPLQTINITSSFF